MRREDALKTEVSLLEEEYDAGRTDPLPEHGSAGRPSVGRRSGLHYSPCDGGGCGQGVVVPGPRPGWTHLSPGPVSWEL